jgi:hypothetical protein
MVKRTIKDRIFGELANMRFNSPEDERKADNLERRAIRISDKVQKFSADSKAKAQQKVHDKIFGKKKKQKPVPLRKQILGF